MSVLVKRIARVIRKARYHPAEVEDEEAAALEVIQPYVSREFKGSSENRGRRDWRDVDRIS
jgi:hypothetical protein